MSLKSYYPKIQMSILKNPYFVRFENMDINPDSVSVPPSVQSMPQLTLMVLVVRKMVPSRVEYSWVEEEVESHKMAVKIYDLLKIVEIHDEETE